LSKESTEHLNRVQEWLTDGKQNCFCSRVTLGYVTTSSSTPRRPAAHTWSLVSLVVALVIAPLAFLAHHTVVLATDTDRVSGALEPLLDTPQVQEGLVDSLTEPLETFLTSDELIQRIVDSAGLSITVPEVLDDALTELLQPLIDETLAAVNQGVAEIIASDPFARSWRQIIADTHADFADIVTSDRSEPAEPLDLSLRPFLVDIRDGLADQGFEFVSGVPVPEVGVEVVDSETMTSLRGAISFARLADPWGVALTGILLATALVTSPRRSRTWAVTGGGVALGMMSVVAALWLVRTVWLPIQFPNQTEIATAVTDALLAYPVSQAALIAVVAGTVGAVGWAIESRISRQKAMT